MNNSIINKIVLNQINEIAGKDMEGNICYLNKQVPENNEFYDVFEIKRRNIVAIARKYNNVTEIGFNAGHSAALMLSASPNLKLTSVDIGCHSYTIPCANVIQRYFPDRFNLILKDSSKLDQNEIVHSDVVIIDGGHTFENCLLDIAICVAYCKSGTLIVIDDYDYLPVFKATNRFLSSFKICNEFVSNDMQRFFYLI